MFETENNIVKNETIAIRIAIEQPAHFECTTCMCGSHTVDRTCCYAVQLGTAMAFTVISFRSLVFFTLCEKPGYFHESCGCMYKTQSFNGLRVTFRCMVCISVNTDICAHINWTQSDHFHFAEQQAKKWQTKRRAVTIFVAVIFLSHSHLHTHLDIHTRAHEPAHILIIKCPIC